MRGKQESACTENSYLVVTKNDGTGLAHVLLSAASPASTSVGPPGAASIRYVCARVYVRVCIYVHVCTSLSVHMGCEQREGVCRCYRPHTRTHTHMQTNGFTHTHTHTHIHNTYAVESIRLAPPNQATTSPIS